jgi:hypothetical protein
MVDLSQVMSSFGNGRTSKLYAFSSRMLGGLSCNFQSLPL